MSRDEWVTLPVAGQVEPRRFRREDIGDYWPRQFQDGEGVMLMRRHTDLTFTIPLPLAEFEALLFGQPERDAYTRAAVRYAEAAYEERLTRGWMPDKAIAELAEAERAFEAVREMHGG